MSAELRLKKLRGSGGYVMATVNDQQQMKGNLGGPDLFLAPIGRLDSQKITKHFCNTCEKEFEGPPKITHATQPGPATAVSSIEGLAVYDESAKKIGKAKQVGIDSNQSVVLLVIKNDGTEGSIPWNSIRKVGEVILLGSPVVTAQPGK